MQTEKRIINRLTLFSAGYVSLFVLSPVLSNRIVDLFGFKVIVGSIAVTFAYGILDVINNGWGKDAARQVIVASVFVRMFIIGFVLLTFLLPTSSEEMGYRKIMGLSFRIYAAGEIGTFVSQYFIDVPIFHRLKECGGAFWIRYNLSTILSQGVSIFLMVGIAFVGTDKPVVQIMFGQFVFRMFTAIILTPVFSLMARSVVWRN